MTFVAIAVSWQSCADLPQLLREPISLYMPVQPTDSRFIEDYEWFDCKHRDGCAVRLAGSDSCGENQLKDGLIASFASKQNLYPLDGDHRVYCYYACLA